MASPDGRAHGYARLLAYSALAAFIGIFVKLMSGIAPIEILFFRMAVAGVCVAAFVLVRGKTSELSLVELPRTLLVVVFQGLNTGLYITALQYVPVSNAVFLLYTAPVFSVILARVFLNERIEPRTILGIAAATVGTLLIVNPSSLALGSDALLGNLLALGAGFSFAAMAAVSKSLSQKVSSAYVPFWQYIGVAAFCIFFLSPSSLSAGIANWWQLLGLGFLSTAVAYILFMQGVKLVKAQHVFIITSVETVFATGLAALILHEMPSWLALLGAAFILAGAYAITKGSGDKIQDKTQMRKKR